MYGSHTFTSELLFKIKSCPPPPVFPVCPLCIKFIEISQPTKSPLPLKRENYGKRRNLRHFKMIKLKIIESRQANTRTQ